MPTILWLLLFAGVAGIALLVAFITHPGLFKPLAQGVRQLQNVQQTPLDDHSLDAQLAKAKQGSAIAIRMQNELESRDLLVQSTTRLQIQKNEQTRTTWVAILLEGGELLIKIEGAWFLLKSAVMSESEEDEISFGQRHLLPFRFANKRWKPQESQAIAGITTEIEPFIRKANFTVVNRRSNKSILLTLNSGEIVLSALIGKPVEEIVGVYNKL